MESGEVYTPALLVTVIERRRHVRFSANQEIRVRPLTAPLSDTQSARMVDVSEGGLSFTGTRLYLVGSAVLIEFEDCQLRADVRSCRMRDYAARAQFVTGVEIQEVMAGVETWKELMRSVQ